MDGSRNAAISWLILANPSRPSRTLLIEPVAVMADVDEEVVEVFEDGLLPVLDGGGQLGEEQGGHGRVLVACVRSFQVSVRLLEREQEAMGPGLVDPFADPLEADEQVVFDANALATGDGAGHLASRPGS